MRDLVPKTGAVDPDDNFRMKYELIDRNTKHVDAIARAVKDADTVLLATDPDREGEAIAWHLSEILKSRKALKDKKLKRVVFYEITEGAVKDAVKHPRAISMELVNAQQARRALDYLVGFNLSPLLWKKIRRDVTAFLMLLWRDGALMGASPEEAFFVQCDEATNPPEVIDAGMVVTMIGIAPVKPAEFVVFRIGQHQTGTQVE